MVKENSVTSVADEDDPGSTHGKETSSNFETQESSTSVAPSSLGTSVATLPTCTTNANVVSSTGKSKKSIAMSTSTEVNTEVNAAVNTVVNTTSTTVKIKKSMVCGIIS